MAGEKDDDPLTEAEQAATEAGDADAALRKEKEQTKKAMLRGEGEPVERDEPARADEPAAARARALRLEHAVVIVAALGMGLLAGVLLARSGGELATGGRPILIPLAAEVFFLGIAFLLIHGLNRR